MNRRSFLTSSLAAAAAAAKPGWPASGPKAPEFYVAPSGRDENPGSKSKPFATIQRARDEVRKLIVKGLKTNVIVWIRGGTYTLRDTLIFGPEDSGTDQYSITYQAVPGEEPTVSSAVEIEGWKKPDTMLSDLPVPAEGNVWVADLPESLGRFCTLYDQQGHLRRAQGNGFVPGDPPAGVDRTDRVGRLRNLYYPAGMIRNWSNLNDVEVIIRYSSTMNILGLESVDETAGVARTSLPGTYALRRLNDSNGTRPCGWKMSWRFWTTPALGCSIPTPASFTCGRGRRSQKASWRRGCVN